MIFLDFLTFVVFAFFGGVSCFLVVNEFCIFFFGRGGAYHHKSLDLEGVKIDQSVAILAQARSPPPSDPPPSDPTGPVFTEEVRSIPPPRVATRPGSPVGPPRRRAASASRKVALFFDLPINVSMEDLENQSLLNDHVVERSHHRSSKVALLLGSLFVAAAVAALCNGRSSCVGQFEGHHEEGRSRNFATAFPFGLPDP